MYIGIIGHFGGKESFNDGQTVKTMNIYNGLLNSGISTIDKIDTYYIKRNPIKFLFIFMFISFKALMYPSFLSLVVFVLTGPDIYIMLMCPNCIRYFVAE